MEKYSFEFKLKLVRSYLQGEGSFRFLGKKHGVDYSNIKRWCANYKEYGKESLKRGRKNQKYAFDTCAKNRGLGPHVKNHPLDGDVYLAYQPSVICM